MADILACTKEKSEAIWREKRMYVSAVPVYTWIFIEICPTTNSIND